MDDTATSTPAPRTDPEPPPPPRRSAGALKRWRARIIVLLMLAAAVFASIRIADVRSHDTTDLPIGTVTLTAQSIPVAPVLPGRVVSVAVKPLQHVVAGQVVAKVLTVTTTGTGGTVESTVELRAPVAGIVGEEPAAVGTALQGGQVFVRLYDPTQLTLVATVPLTDIPKLARGMTAVLRGPDIPQPIEAVVDKALPRLSDTQSTVAADHLAIQLTPKDRGYVTQLVPGLQFSGTVDTKSAPNGAKPSFYLQG